MAVFTALLMPALLGMAGLALDAGNIYLAHSRLQAATDAAALAGGLALPYDPDIAKDGQVMKAVTDMLKRNQPGATVTSVVPGALTRSVKVTAASTVDLYLVRLLGFHTGTVQASASAGFNNLEIVFVIDNTGSMKGPPIENVRIAAENLVDLILPDGMAPSIKVGLVPFRGKVHVGKDVDDLAAGCRNADGSYNAIHYKEVTIYDKRGRPVRTEWQETNQEDGSCNAIPEILALSTDKKKITDAIKKMNAEGNASGTVIAEGLKWGRKVLDPEKHYMEGGERSKFRKIMILLTDGDNEDGKCGGNFAASSDPNAYHNNAHYGMRVKNRHCENGGLLNSDMLDEAKKAKDDDMEIFTIRFGDSDATDVQLMKTVASSKAGTNDHYFDAPSEDKIDDVFKQIGQQLGWRLLN